MTFSSALASRVARSLAASGLVAGLGLGVGAPAASAAVTPSCSISGCAAAVSAWSTWSAKGFPSSRGWYSWPNGLCNFAGGTYHDDNGELPAGDRFLEFDVTLRACGAHRDAKRIVVDRTTGQAWYSPDHYADFYEFT